MKKYSIFSLGFIMLAGLILSFSSVVQAEDTGSVEKPYPGKVMQEKRQDAMGKMKEKTSAEGEAMKEKRQEMRGEIKADVKAFKEKMQTERKTFVDKLKTDREAFKLDLKAKKDEWKTAKADRKADFCAKAKNMTETRFSEALKKLAEFQAKAGEMEVKLKADGKDTLLVVEALNLSKQKLADAKQKLAEVKALIPTGGCENMTPEIFEKIKLGAREAKDLLKESREALYEAVKVIRNLKNSEITN